MIARRQTELMRSMTARGEGKSDKSSFLILVDLGDEF
jgi:hypothetical protein